jgi:hypothetical protein
MRTRADVRIVSPESNTAIHAKSGGIVIKNASPVNLVVIGLGLALIVFVAGVSTILALNRAVPTEMWAAGGAISGALIGLLVPAPGSGNPAPAAAGQQAAPPAQPVAAQQVATQPQPVQPAVQQAPAQPQPVQQVAQQAPAQPQPVQQVAQQAPAQPRAVQPVAQKAANAPAASGTSSEPPPTHIAFVILLLIVFLLTLVSGVALSAGWIVPPSGFTETLHEATKVLIALASASGTALIGVFAPTSQHG